MSLGSPDRVHIKTPDDITTINYTLEWPHLENPTNTTFAGATQIDICRCPQDGSQPDTCASEPGHIYTRYECPGPEVHFTSADDQLWVLHAPHGPINMLRPAIHEERQRRKEVHDEADPATYQGRNFLFLTGPCPRGRYQAYATLQFLKSLSPAARQHVTQFSLLLQPFEEDCVDMTSKQSYEELATYIIQFLPNFQVLCLNIWDDESRLRRAASEFALLLHKEDVKIVVGWSWWKYNVKEYTSARAFLEDMTSKTESQLRKEFDNSHLKDGSTLDVEGLDEDSDEKDDRERSIHNMKDLDEKDKSKAEEDVESKQSEPPDQAAEPVSSRDRPDHRSRSSSHDTTIHIKDTEEPSITTPTSAASQHAETENDKHIRPKAHNDDLSCPTPASATSSSQISPQTVRSDEDYEWIDATLSPVSPLSGEDNWQVL